MKSQNGFSIAAVLAVGVGFVIHFAIVGLVIWAICHFVAKYW